MTERDIELARQIDPVAWVALHQDDMDWVQQFAALIRADERERIKAANAPEIELINAHLKSLEDAVKEEREACAKICDFEWGTGAEKDAGIMFASAIRARSGEKK